MGRYQYVCVYQEAGPHFLQRMCATGSAEIVGETRFRIGLPGLFLCTTLRPKARASGCTKRSSANLPGWSFGTHRNFRARGAEGCMITQAVICGQLVYCWFRRCQRLAKLFRWMIGQQVIQTTAFNARFNLHFLRACFCQPCFFLLIKNI